MLKILLLFSCLAAGLLCAQSVPVIESTTGVADYRVGENFYEQAWTVTPSLEVDPLVNNTLGTRITFYTDQDSISTLVSTTPFDFIVRWNGDSALTRIVYEQSKLDLLRDSAATYVADGRTIPDFSYAPSSQTDLLALRQTYNLDSIAGEGNEVSRMLNLMHWVHHTIRHDGGKNNPDGIFNANHLVGICRNGGNTLNCRGLAIVLNEVYLAMGFPSRYLTCLPRDPDDFDCHVINAAWSSELKKWLWLDPTHDTYVMDETGTLLSVPEVRNRILAGQTLILSPSANWNNRVTTEKSFYLDEYMAKNLFYIRTPLVSTTDYESQGEGRHLQYLQLIPERSLPHFAPVRKRGDDQQSTTTYFTSDAEIFWAAPLLAK